MTIEMLILSLLSIKDMYGHQLVQELSVQSNGNLTMREGAIYPLLYRLTDKSFLTTRNEQIGIRRTRVYYHLEIKGCEYLAQLRQKYRTMQNGISSILEYVDRSKPQNRK